MRTAFFDDGFRQIYNGDSREVAPDLGVRFDAVVCDPPYEIGFMSKSWDRAGVAFEVATWEAILSVMKPGAHLLAFSSPRTEHRLAVAIEDAGFEIRDKLIWLYGSGMPKSLNVSKAIDSNDRADTRRGRALKFTEWIRSTGLTAHVINKITNTNMGGHYTTAAEQPEVATRAMFETLRPYFTVDVPAWVECLVDDRTVESENFKRRPVVGTVIGKPVSYKPGEEADNTEKEIQITESFTPEAKKWDGWGTGLKPCYEPIILARKPLESTVAGNVLLHGTGAINVGACRVGDEHLVAQTRGPSGPAYGDGIEGTHTQERIGRWPGNVLLDEQAAELLDREVGDSGGPSRFFYTAKASRSERDNGTEVLEGKTREEITGREAGSDGQKNGRAGITRQGRIGNHHPTVKPVNLMRWLIRLVCPKGGVLDPFMGSGSTLVAAREDFVNAVGIDLDPEFCDIAKARLRQGALPFSEED